MSNEFFRVFIHLLLDAKDIGNHKITEIQFKIQNSSRSFSDSSTKNHLATGHLPFLANPAHSFDFFDV